MPEGGQEGYLSMGMALCSDHQQQSHKSEPGNAPELSVLIWLQMEPALSSCFDFCICAAGSCVHFPLLAMVSSEVRCRCGQIKLWTQRGKERVGGIERIVFAYIHYLV